MHDPCSFSSENISIDSYLSRICPFHLIKQTPLVVKQQKNSLSRQEYSTSNTLCVEQSFKHTFATLFLWFPSTLRRFNSSHRHSYIFHTLKEIKPYRRGWNILKKRRWIIYSDFIRTIYCFLAKRRLEHIFPLALFWLSSIVIRNHIQ